MALLMLPDVSDVACEIRNFCPKGLQLKPNGTNAALTLANEGMEGEVVFAPTGKSESFRIQGKLSHVSSRGIGFIFNHAPAFQVLQALQEKAAPRPLLGKVIHERIKGVHEQCVQAFAKALSPILEDLPRSAMRELGGMDWQGSNAGASDLPFGSEEIMSDRLKSVVNAFYDQATEQVRTFVVPILRMQPEADAIYCDSFFRRHLFEDWINLIAEVVRLENKFETQVSTCSSHLEPLVGRKIANHENPFGPNVLFHLFHFSLASLSLQIGAKKKLYGLFSQVLDECLEKLYEDLQNLIIPLQCLETSVSKPTNAGPERFSLAIEALELEAVPGFDGDQTADVPFPFHELAANSSSLTTYNEQPKSGIEDFSEMPLRPLPSLDLDYRGPDANSQPTVKVRPVLTERASGSSEVFDPPDAFTAFVLLTRYAESREQSEPPPMSSEYDPQVIVEALKKLLAESADYQDQYLTAPKLQAGLMRILSEIGREELLSCVRVREILQITGLLLDAILADSSIPNGIMPYFRKLQIPLLIIAYADPNFLHGKSHPARDVLNQLDHLALATNAKGEIDNEKLIHSLNDIFQNIYSGEASNSAIFLESLNTLSQLTAPLIRANSIRLERVAESCEGGHKLEQSRLLVEREIDARIGGKTVHPVILSFIEAGWRQLLVLTNLRKGTDNDEWRRQLSIIDLLLTELDKNSTAHPYDHSSVREIREYILEQLSSIGAETADTERIVDEIGNILISVAANTTAYVDVPPIDSAREEKENMLQARLQGFHVGDWLKFALARNGWTLLRLTWIGQKPARYAFVNRKGVKTLDLDAAKFIQLLDEKRAGRIESVEVFPLVERTAKSLLHTLRDRLR